MRLRDKIFEKARKSNLIRRIYVSIFNSYEREWDLWGRNEDKAIKNILNVEDIATRVIKENGKAYLQFPNLLCDYNLRNFLDASKQKYRRVSRMRYYTPIEIEKILQAIGFKIDSLVERSDYEDQDNKHKNYSIYVLASKSMKNTNI